jgi:hypothetical protein
MQMSFKEFKQNTVVVKLENDQQHRHNYRKDYVNSSRSSIQLRAMKIMITTDRPNSLSQGKDIIRRRRKLNQHQQLHRKRFQAFYILHNEDSVQLSKDLRLSTPDADATAQSCLLYPVSVFR